MEGMVKIDHNFGGQDNLAYKTETGSGVFGADIRLFRKRDWDAGNRSARFVYARATTDKDGRWTAPVTVPPGEYVVVVGKPGAYGPNTCEITAR